MPGVVFAGVVDVDRLWVLANISVGICSLPNLVAVLVLSGAFFKLMQDFLSGQNRYTTSLIDKSREYVQSPPSTLISRS
jgi:Na+/alanine symporter